MKKSSIINLIKCFSDHNDNGFRSQAAEIANEFYLQGDSELSEYIMSLIATSDVFVPQVIYDQQELNYCSRVSTDSPSIFLPTEINEDIMGLINAISYNVGINRFMFYGAPGTGKTETVKQIARILNRELYVVDFDLLIDSKIDPSLADDTILLACPEALSEKDGMLCLTRMEKNRHYYCEISGNSIAKIFDDYMSLFFNKRFADSLQNVLSCLTRTSVTVKENGNSVQKNGAEILKKKFREKREELLNELNQKKAKSQGDDRKVYGILFSIIKNRYDSYQKFIG